jgi:hypothetical protein
LTKRNYLFIFPALVLLFLNSCANKRANLQLEPDPHAISRRLNMPAARHPHIALDPSGDTVYVLAVAGSDPVSQLVLLTSVNGGDTFEPPVSINEPGTNVSSHGENSPVMLFGPGEKIYTMWEQQDGEAAAIMFAASLDFGATLKNRLGCPIKLPPLTAAIPLSPLLRTRRSALPGWISAIRLHNRTLLPFIFRVRLTRVQPFRRI